jgi:hypothetical protein
MNLKIGIFGSGISFTILKEFLNHIGIIYEPYKKDKEYPLVIISDSENFTAFIDENTIVFDEIIPIDKVTKILNGQSESILETPLLNEYEKELLNQIRKSIFDSNLPLVRKWFWPSFEKYCCIITHDIDRLNIPPNNYMHKTPIIMKIIAHLQYVYKRKIQKKNEFTDYIDLLIDIEKKYSVKSSFYFFPEYTEEKRFLKILDQLQKDNFEIGLHSNSSNYIELEEEIKKFEDKKAITIKGTRQHLLKFDAHTTWQYQEKLLEYDLSFYFNEYFGFRAGLCNPYRPLNTSSIIEIPTSFMDWTALNLEMNYQEIEEKLNKVIHMIEEYNGCLVVNYHNEYFNKLLYPHIYKSFIYILKHIQTNYWITTSRECTKWWKLREKAHIDICLKERTIIGTSTDNIPIVIESPASNEIYTKATSNFSFQIEM